jgi:hypothetical protein
MLHGKGRMKNHSVRIGESGHRFIGSSEDRDLKLSPENSLMLHGKGRMKNHSVSQCTDDAMFRCPDVPIT